MADLSITAANVQMTASSTAKYAIAAEVIIEGESVRVGTNGQLYKAIASSTAADAAAGGIAVTAAAIGARCGYTDGGQLTIGATLTLNTLYVVSGNSGKIAPIADLITGDWVTPLGIPVSTTVLDVNPDPRAFQIP